MLQPSHREPFSTTFEHQRRRIVWTGMWIVWNSNLGSSLPSGAIDDISRYFSINNPSQLVLLNSLYLVGYTVGPPVFGPLSEHIGRRPVLLGTYVAYLAFTAGCALSRSYNLLLAFRLLSGLVAAAPNAVVGGLFADVHKTAEDRGKAMAYFVSAATMGPPVGPIISGIAGRHSWQLGFWIGLALGGAGLPLVLALPETFAPVLQRRQQASTLTDEPGNNEQLPGSDLTSKLRVVFARPFIMMVHEPVVLFSSVYLALVYAILYLFFQAYPIIFSGVYEMSPTFSGLAFIPVLAGLAIALGLFMLYDKTFVNSDSVRARDKIEEYRRLPLACVGGPSIAVALFWLGWSSFDTIHPVIPMMSGLLFGIGYLLIFMAMLNYITDAYPTFSASANAAASATRSLAAVALPFAAAPMYTRLGVQWASSVLGFAALIMSIIPFLFLKYGNAIRMRSPLCQGILEASDSAAADDDTRLQRLRRSEVTSQ